MTHLDAAPILTVADAARHLRSGTLTSTRLTSDLLARADALDPLLATFVTRFKEDALEQAARADEGFARGIDRGPYQGIPIGVKDLLAVAEGPTTANSRILDPEWGAGKDAPVVQRLKAAGSVIVGKTTTSEFAIGSPDPSTSPTIPRNPWNTERTPGVSSAGTGSGIAAGLMLAGIGTDTAGSIRIPAAYCGITGLKPTFGRVPKSGCVPLAFSLDHVGPMARSARDCADMLDIIAGYHPSDETSVDRPVEQFGGSLTGDLTGLRIGVERTYHFPVDSDPALLGCFDAAIAELVALGATVVDVTLPSYEQTLTALWITLMTEGLAYHRDDLIERWDDYNPQTRVNLARGALSTAADYIQAGRIRRVAQRELAGVFDRVDAIAAPLASTGALAHQALMDMRPANPMATTVFTGYWDAVGAPALVVPMGFATDGLPLSLQLAGRPFDEATLLRIGDAYQRCTSWHRQVPPLLTEILEKEAAGEPLVGPPVPAPVEPAPVADAGPFSDADKAVVRAALGLAGIRASEDDVAILASGYPAGRAAADALYGRTDARYVPPGLIFDPDPTLADWF